MTEYGNNTSWRLTTGAITEIIERDAEQARSMTTETTVTESDRHGDDGLNHADDIHSTSGRQGDCGCNEQL